MPHPERSSGLSGFEPGAKMAPIHTTPDAPRLAAAIAATIRWYAIDAQRQVTYNEK
jgi:hypothetical protein